MRRARLFRITLGELLRGRRDDALSGVPRRGRSARTTTSTCWRSASTPASSRSAIASPRCSGRTRAAFRSSCCASTMPATCRSGFPPAPSRSRNSAAPVPLWNVHSTFDTPDRLLKQVIELPDGTRYFSIAQMVRRPVAPHPLPQPRFAIGLGCEIRHAARLDLCRRHGPGEDGGHPDRRQLPPLRARKLRPARRAADHAHADPGRDDAAGVELVRILECTGVVKGLHDRRGTARATNSLSSCKRSEPGPITTAICVWRRLVAPISRHGFSLG